MICFRRGFVLALSSAVLGGCIAPITSREAQSIANTRLTRYCNGRCGALALGRTQMINGRWLVDFEAPRQKFTVIVEGDGNSQVTAWEK